MKNPQGNPKIKPDYSGERVEEKDNDRQRSVYIRIL